MSKKSLKLSREWAEHPLVADKLVDTLSNNQKDVMTPIIINSNNIDGIRKSFVELFRKTNLLFSPLTFRYSYSFNISGRRNITVVPLYYLEKDINSLLNDYKIVTHIDHLVPTGSKWEEEAYENIKFFSSLECEKAIHKLVKVKDSEGLYHGWECKELFKDKPVK
jgi:hypothetical protein